MATDNAQNNTELETISNEELSAVAGGAGAPVEIKGIDLPDIDTGAIEALRGRLGGGTVAQDDTHGYVVF